MSPLGTRIGPPVPQSSALPSLFAQDPQLAPGALAFPAVPAAETVPAPDWAALEPRGWYPTIGRPTLLLLLELAVLPFALPLGLAIALVNWIVFADARKIFFVQPRVGHRGKVFQLVKFRTMKDAPEGNFEAWSAGKEQARVTRFGRFLRNSHLDELAQFVNVLRGDMDIVGPRPEMLEIESWAQQHVPGFSCRLALKPGITGLAQITQGYTGLDVEAYRRKLEINEEYRRKLSLGFDLRILCRTVLWMLRGRGWQWNRSTRKAGANGSEIPPPPPEADSSQATP